MKNVAAKNETLTVRGAELVVDSLIQQGVTHVFGIPGAKIDAVYDVLKDKGPELIVCRHEQNAAFMAAAVGRLTGKPGVCLVTSGPGASNLATGLVTANTEGDPVVALAGAVKERIVSKELINRWIMRRCFSRLQNIAQKWKMRTTSLRR